MTRSSGHVEDKPTHHRGEAFHPYFNDTQRAEHATIAILLTLFFIPLLLLFMTLTAPEAQAQYYQVIHQFTGGADGAMPWAGLTSDAAGNLYGTTAWGGAAGLGTVFRLLRKNGRWVITPLYSFRGGDDGVSPAARVIFGPDGNLYGTTYGGGGSGNYGTVFKLTPSPNPPPNIFGDWQETVLYRFNGGSDGATPSFGDLAFDAAGNIYGTTTYGGSNGFGVIFQLTSSASGWTETVIYNFDEPGGRWPYSGVMFDAAGNAYGTTSGGGANESGTVYQLSPSPSGWVHTVLYDFQGGSAGGIPIGGVTFTPSGQMLGTSSGAWNGSYPGTAFLLGHHGMERIWDFGSGSYYYGGAGPWAAALAEPGQSGNDDIYGTTYASGVNGYGSVFKMYWACYGCYCTYYQDSLHDFTSDDAYPISNLLPDAGGNLYGTTSGWSMNYSSGYGSVFEIGGALRSRTGTANASSCATQR